MATKPKDIAEEFDWLVKMCGASCWNCGKTATMKYVWPGGDKVTFVCDDCPNPTQRSIPWR